MKTYYITVQNSTGTPYDLEVEASSPEDVMGQVRALSAGTRLGMRASKTTEILNGTPEVFELANLSTSKTRGREYIVLSEWIRS